MSLININIGKCTSLKKKGKSKMLQTDRHRQTDRQQKKVSIKLALNCDVKGKVNFCLLWEAGVVGVGGVGG